MRAPWGMLEVAICALVGTGTIAHAQDEDDEDAELEDPELEDEDEDDLGELSLEELMAVSVTTASNVAEPIGDAPASMIVLTRQELEERGYTELGDIFDDLPGMDVARPYGDNWVLVYWRGFRGDVSAPFLLMIDGLPVNSLYFLDVDVPITAMPLTAIERVEVVQGPASSVYGPNAFMGVINVITLADAETDGVHQYARLGFGSDGGRIADATVLYKRDDIRFRMSARFETGLLDDAHVDQYEYTREDHFSDRDLWGGFVDNPNLAGFRSRHTSRAIEAHLYVDQTELAARWLGFSSGYGVEYAGDKVLNNAVWAREELDVYLRHHRPLTERLESRTVIRHRRSGIPNESYFVDGYDDASAGRVAAFSYWQAHNDSWGAYQDVAMKPVRGFSFIAGLKLERKDLQKAYDIVGESAAGTPGGYEPVGTIDAGDYAYPAAPPKVREPQNRILTEDVGAYLQTRYDVGEDHHLHLGGRIDRNSGYDVAPTLRLGYVGQLGGGVSLKALYGQAFQEPPPRVLYGGWTGSGSDPELAPQRSQTFEVDGALTLTNLWQGVAAYLVYSTDTIVVGAMPRNAGKQTVVGLDYSFRGHLKVPRFERVEVWGSYTRLFHAEEEVTDAAGATQRTRIGDLSNDKLHLGVTARYDHHLVGTLRGRWFGARQTTPTNPVRRVDDFATADFTVLYRDLFDTGVGVSAAIENLTDARYTHPGINDASAGAQAGGSLGYFNSEMPQPGRTFMVSLMLQP